MQNQINTSPLSQFAQILRAAEQTQSKEVKLSIQQARAINTALVEILDKINQDYETVINEIRKNQGSEVVTVAMDGGGFDDK
jgi:hypothetical protein